VCARVCLCVCVGGALLGCWVVGFGVGGRWGVGGGGTRRDGEKHAERGLGRVIRDKARSNVRRRGRSYGGREGGRQRRTRARG
jgi:hypothetical protein